MHKQILRLAIPNIISNITIPLLGAVDLAMMGRFDNIAFAGAVSLGAMIFNFMYWALGFLRMGTAGFTAQAYGAALDDEKGRILGRSLFIALLGALLLWIIQDLILVGVAYYINPEPQLWSLTQSYFKIRIWGAPAAIAAFAFGGWFIGMQNTRIPMWIAIAINVFNIGFNYLFVFVLGMHVEGVALGTVISQYLGLLLNIFCLYFLFPKERKHLFDKAVLQKKAFLRFLNINKDVFIRTLCIIFVFSFFTAESTKYGNTTLVLNTILYEFFIFFSYAVDGFGHAGEALTGKFTGANLFTERRKCIGHIFIWGTALTALFLLLYSIFYTQILHLFTSNSEVLALTPNYFYWVLLVTLVGFPAFLWDGIFAGALKTRPMLFTMLFSTATYFILYYTFQSILGNNALWLSLASFLLLRGVIMTIFAKSLFGIRFNTIKREP